MKDPYEVLELKRGASEEEVKKEVVNMKCNHSKEQNEVLLENIVAFIEAHYEGGHDHE